MEGRLEVQGIVAARPNDQVEPLVQFRQIEDGEPTAQWQAGVIEAREMAQQIIEAASNAVYDAALIAWAREEWPDDLNMAEGLVSAVREYRADSWGLPDQPKDW